MPIKRSRPKRTGVPGVVQDGPERFLVTVTWNDKRTGRRRKREAVASSLAEAVELKAQLRGSPASPSPLRPRFGGYGEQWMARRSRSRSRPLAPSSRDRYINSVAHLTVFFGDWWVEGIDENAVEDWQESAAETAAPATVNGIHRVLRLVLDRAVRDKLLTTNPARAVPTLPEGRTKGPRGRSMDADEFRRFVQAAIELSDNGISADTSRHALTLAWTGMRMGESMALRFEDIVDGELRIERSVWHRHEKSTKTGDPRRVTIVEPLQKILEEQRQWLLKAQHPGLESGLVFPARPSSARQGLARRTSDDELSWYRTHSVLNTPLRRIAERAGIEPISPHSLRRTFEDLLRNAGVEQLVRRAVAGWRTERAQGIYANVNRADRDAAAEALVNLVLAEGEK